MVRRRAVPPSRLNSERRLVLVVGAVVFVDTMFYAAIAPLLPALARELHLSKLSAGLMTASYPIGTLVGSIPGGILAVRAGPKRTVMAGLVLMALSTLAFGFLHNAPGLDAARFVEGVGGACSWAGGLAWIIAEAPVSRRGKLIGSALGAAIGGALFGPVIGAVAAGVGRGLTFSAVVVFALVLMAAAGRLHSPAPQPTEGVRQLARAVRQPAILAGMWLVGLPALASGMINVLGPLRLHRLGAGAVAIGVTYLAAAGFEAIVSPAIGGLSDRRGRLLPLRSGLIVAGVFIAAFTLPTDAVTLAIFIIVAGTALGAFWAPAMALLSEAAENHGIEQGLAAALMNLAWAGGQIAGAGGGGGLAKGAGDGLPTLLAAGLCLLTLVSLVRAAGGGRLRTSAPPPAP